MEVVDGRIGRVEGRCVDQQLEACNNFNKFLIRQPDWELFMIAHDPHTSLEDILKKGTNRIKRPC